MNSDNTRELLVEAANRAANYIEGLRVRDVRPLRGSVERLMGVLDGPLPDNPSRPTDVLALSMTMDRPRLWPAQVVGTLASSPAERCR